MISILLKNTHDSLIENSNTSHEKIKFTIETNPQKFQDTQLLLENNIIKTEVYRKTNKFSLYWKSKILERLKKCNKWRSVSFMENFYHEKNETRNKVLTAGYPMRFLNSVINDFESKKHDPMIPSFLFNDFE